jgi:acyl-coenzyme A thioesterase PaaI-like protein
VGLVHGGMLSAFMDGVLAGAVWRGAQRRAVTIHLSIDFLHMARVGEWVMGEARLTRATRDVAFAEGRAYVGGHDVVRCSGIFKLMNRER